MGGKVERYFVPAVIGFAPVVLLLLTWAEQMSPMQNALRETTAIVLAAELFTIFAALRSGAVRTWRTLRPPVSALVALAVLVFVAVATALLVAPAQGVAIARTCYLIVHLLFGGAVLHLCTREFESRDLIHAYLAGFLAFALLFAIYAANAFHSRVAWTFGLPSVTHIRHIGIYATPIIALSYGILAATQPGRRWSFALAAATAGWALTLWTGSRGPLVSIAAAYALGLVLVPQLRRLRSWAPAAGSLAVGGTLAALLPVPAKHMGLWRTVEQTAQSGDVLTGRSVMWAQVIDAIGRNPVFGYGEGQMNSVAPFYGLAQPHNLVLQILLAWGVVGLLCSAVLALHFAWRAVPAVRREAAELTGPLLAMLALIALSMLDAALYHILPISIFAACAAMIAARWGAATAAGR
jgi:O-antigen ligase